MEKCRDVGLAPAPDNQMAVIAGCAYVEDARYVKDGKYWLRLKCEKCGDVSESWSKQPIV